MPGTYINLIFALAALYIVLMITMRLLRRTRRRIERPLQTDFTVADLHQLLAAGKITPDEFERLKETLLAHQAPLARKRDGTLYDPTRPEKGKRGFDVLPTPPPPRPE